jgi:hypothetical protein
MERTEDRGKIEDAEFRSTEKNVSRTALRT